MKVTQKNLLRTIKGSLGRFVAIMAIIALGAAIFVGLLLTKSDMVATGQKFMDQQHMFDLRLYSSYGWSQTEVDAVAKLPGVDRAEGMISMDVIGQRGEGKASVYKLHAIPELVDQVYLLGGRMPENPDECLVDGFHTTDAMIGTEFTITTENTQDTLDSFTYHTFTVVGYVSTPLYMDMNRGTTSLGNGSVAGYIYLPRSAFDTDYYTDISVTLEGDYAIYTEAFDSAMEEMAESIKPGTTVLAYERYDYLKHDAKNAYEDGRKAYEDGLKDYEKGRKEALASLSDAYDQLHRAQDEIDENRALMEDGMRQLLEGQLQLDEQQQLIITSRRELADAKAEAYSTMAAAQEELLKNYKQVNDGLQQVSSGLAQIEEGLALLEDGIAKLEDGLEKVESGKSLLQLVLPLKEAQVETLEASLTSTLLTEELKAALQTQLETAKAELEEYRKQAADLDATEVTLTAQLEDALKQQQEVLDQKTELLETKQTLEAALETINQGFVELESSQSQANNQFASAEAKLESGQLQLDEAQRQLDLNRQALEDGLRQLEAGQAELDIGWQEYTSGKQTAERELTAAWAELEAAAQQLAEAREQIDTMDAPAVIILDRNTNAGYVSLESNSDIVAGVSKVFPAFFLLVAALVCITTMTRMVEEERMQIGTMKALGYSNGAIIRKYLLYAGLASVTGCGLGVFLGSVVFPVILWQVYGIILNILPNVCLGLNWPLNLTVVGAYTAVMELVTWYCCRRCLKEVPAELLRAKSPTTGKKIWLEYLPFWKKFSFLNKVMLRNVFRYRQRMFMMLVGIGGCTALLLTGFGLRDSIMNIVTEQFQQVTVYDMNVYFSEPQTAEDQEAFRQEFRRELSGSLFYYQTSMEMHYGNKIKSLSMIAAQEEITSFVLLKQDGQPLALPQAGEALVSVGAAEQLNIQVGDQVILQDSDLRNLYVTVTGIFDNNVNSYAIVSPDTILEQWNEAVEPQMAFLNLRDTADLYAVGAKITGREEVLNLSISQDQQNQVNAMLQALNAVVITIVICAGALAAIVLYNLTNINITERIREIATLKVLGFYAGETAAYVFKENLLLSAFGTLAGLVGGKFLLDFVISEIKVDMVYFSASFTALSAALSMVLTMLAACIVDFFLYFKLEKINMAEALKSVE